MKLAHRQCAKCFNCPSSSGRVLSHPRPFPLSLGSRLAGLCVGPGAFDWPHPSVPANCALQSQMNSDWPLGNEYVRSNRREPEHLLNSEKAEKQSVF